MGLIKDINGPTTKSEDAATAYFFDIVTQFLDVVQHTPTDQNKTLMLLARSPDCGIAKAVYHFRDEIKAAGLTLKVIFTQINTSKELNKWLSAESSPLGEACEKHIRWAKSPALTDAHEQLTFSTICNWSGESMRRDINARFGYYIFDVECKEAAQRANNSFKAFWKASVPLPQTCFKRALVQEDEIYTLQPASSPISVGAFSTTTPEFTRH